MAQPYRNYEKDILEPQKYPMKPAGPGQAPERPYDVTGWTLPLQMGVEVFEVKKPFEAKLDRVSPIPMTGGGICGKTAGGKNGGTDLVSHDCITSVMAENA